MFYQNMNSCFPENGRKRKRDEFSSSDESRREESKSARSVGARDDDMDADVIVLGDESTGKKLLNFEN